MNTNPDRILDLRGTITPLAMLEFTNAFSEMKRDGVMEILVGDSETKEDLFNVLRAYPYELLELVENETSIRMRLKRAAERKRFRKGRESGITEQPERKKKDCHCLTPPFHRQG